MEKQKQQKKTYEAQSPSSANQTPSSPATPALRIAISSSSFRLNRPVPKRHGRLAFPIPLGAARRFTIWVLAMSQRTFRHCSSRARLQAARGVYRSVLFAIPSLGLLFVLLFFIFFLVCRERFVQRDSAQVKEYLSMIPKIYSKNIMLSCSHITPHVPFKRICKHTG